ncbi:hypothetical protein HELRODRAFT_90241, partial [Helobdella robusta]|uniref:Gamma-aminobutyric acid receptor subunit beta n=1 Tax=Helobdella robusta TaxID=6412 RepID=T1G7N0_HELRO
NANRLLERLTWGYDKRLRPNYHGDPVEVSITLTILSVSSVSEANMDFTLEFYFRQLWQDKRLEFEKLKEELCISNEMLETIWWPDTFFANAKSANFHAVTTKNAFLRIKHTGWVTLSLRLTVTAICKMDLSYFPLDSQICSLEVESYAYSMRHIIYRWHPSSPINISNDIQLPQYRLSAYRTKDKIVNTSTGEYSRLACDILLERSLGYYVIHIYIPASLIVVLSWISFWIHRDSAPARTTLAGITTVLTMATLISSTNASLPKISYLKSVDVYLISCFVMVFAAILEYTCVSYLGSFVRLSLSLSLSLSLAI